MFEYVTTSEQLNKAVEALGNGQRLAIDTETYTLKEYESLCGNEGRVSPHTGRIALIALKSDTSISYVFDLIWLEHNNYNPQVLIDLIKQAEYIIAQLGLLLSN